MKNIKLIACDIDGVLLKDTFSPVLYNIVKKLGGEYTREIERNVFSRPREEARKYMIKKFNIPNSEIANLPRIFSEEREKYLKNIKDALIEGVPEFLELISSQDVRLVCYGGLSEEKILDDFKKYMHYFDKYICTNDFRPGIKEITKDMYGLEYEQVLFIDDVNTVAEVAKSYNANFIGTPSNFSWGFQKEDMASTEVRYILNSVREIDTELLEKIDFEASKGIIWKT